ncbi:MAG: hypothetical protein R3E13_03445 [Alphaproteobacteria bacterium]
MKKILRITTVSAFALAMGLSSAQADVNVWYDPGSRMSVSYADTWGRVNNQNPGDVLTIRAPGEHAFAECKINVTDDGRFKIYPVHYSQEIQQLNFSRDYWVGYLDRYKDVTIHEGTDNNGLGRGFASMVSASYETVKGAKMRKRAIGFVSQYRNKVYNIECSAQENAYHQWHNAFLNVIKSVNFHDGTNFAISGYYRDFLDDKTLKVRGPSLFEDSYH